MAAAEAARKVACAGARPMAATNCLNFGNPEKPEVMWQLAEAIAGMGEACRALGTPVTGGNVSLYNETLGEGIDPTPVVGVVGKLDLSHGREPLRLRFPGADRAIVLLGSAATGPLNEMGSSEYAAAILGHIWGVPPALDLEKERRLHGLLLSAHERGWLESAHQVSTGGLAVALAECCIADTVERGERPGCGATVQLPAHLDWQALFHEGAGRVLASCTREHARALVALGHASGIEAAEIGATGGEHLRLAGTSGAEVAIPLSEIARSWGGALEQALSAEAVLS